MSREKLVEKNYFIENLELLKQYILKLLWKKQEKIEENVKQWVENIVEEWKTKPWFFDKLRNLFWWKNEERKIDKYESHQEDQDEYIPRDSEFWESLGEEPRFAEINPWLIWYFTSWKKSYFDKNSNLWSKKKNLIELDINPPTSKTSHTYAWLFVPWIISIPLPEWSLPDIDSIYFTWKHSPIFKVDQNNCIYIESKEKQYISFNFYTNQDIPVNLPIIEDSEKIIFNKLSNETKELLNNIKSLNSIEKANAIKSYIIKNKKYSTKLQWTLRDKSNSKNYISNLDKSPVLECFSANTLFVALCREVWIPARLVVWHMVQSLDKEWKSLLSSNNWHAWSDIWDEKNKLWIRIDATPTQKEDWEDSNQNIQEKEWQQWNNQETESNMNQNEWQQWWWEWSSGEKKSGWQAWKWLEQWKEWGWWEKSPTEALEELIKTAKDDNMVKQADQLKKTIEQLENASSKEEIRDILDKSWLSDFAKNEVDKLWNEEILNQEKEELKNLDDEREVDNLEKNSLLNDNEFKSKLQEIARERKKKIQEDKKKMKSEMEKLWFKEEELRLYKLYKELEKELKPEIKKQIKELEKILPPTYRIEEDADNYHKSWNRVWGAKKLVQYEVTKDERVFRRNKEVAETTEINMFETIVIDRSWSMWKFDEDNSPMRETVKAAIIRAKVLEYFKVKFSILIFDTDIEEVMGFWEKFSEKRKNNIPARLMRAVMKSWWTDIWKPLAYTFESMKKYAKKTWLKSFWNISFLWDWEPTDWLKDNELKWLINQIKDSSFWLTAYYINWSSQNMTWLQDYFWSEESWWTVIVWDIKELTSKLIWAYNENLKKIIKRYTNKN